jgi:hypothetical protein
MMRVLFMQLNPAVVAVAALLAVPLNGTPAAALPAQLAESQWRLVEVQSMDSAQGTTRPSPGTTYTMELSRDGSVSMQLNCNRARGTWSAQGSAEASSGGFRFGPLAARLGACGQLAGERAGAAAPATGLVGRGAGPPGQRHAGGQARLPAQPGPPLVPGAAAKRWSAGLPARGSAAACAETLTAGLIGTCGYATASARS